MMLSIMVVGDEENCREHIKVILTQKGYKVVEASSGKECLTLLKTEKPDLILMDMMMPEMSGMLTTQSIRDNPKTKNVKVILLTAIHSAEYERMNVDHLEISDYIPKPVDNENLIRKVRKVIGYVRCHQK